MPTQTSSQSVNQIPQWVSNAGEQNYGLAQSIAEQPLQQFQGQMVADVSPQTQQAWNLAAQSGSVGQPQFQGATAGLLGALGQTPSTINPAQLSNTNLQPYMNPYTQSVINTTLPIMQQNLALSQNQQQNAANSANAFGGSRQGIQQGVTQAQGAMGMGQMAAQLNQANFGQAQTAAQSDVAAQNTAQAQNQAAQQAKINSDIAASQGLTNLGTQAGQLNAANYAMLTSSGAQQQQQAQNDINAQMAKFQQAWNYPTQGLGMLESSLGMTPYDTATASDLGSDQSDPAVAEFCFDGARRLANARHPVSSMSDKKVEEKHHPPVAQGSGHPNPDQGVQLQGRPAADAEDDRAFGAGHREGGARFDRQSERRSGCST